MRRERSLKVEVIMARGVHSSTLRVSKKISANRECRQGGREGGKEGQKESLKDLLAPGDG